jgi:hypothetical protein
LSAMSDPAIRLLKPRKQRSGCVGQILVTVVGGIVLLILGAFGSSWKTTFDECAKTEAELRSEYFGLSWEIYAREARIATVLAQAKSVTELRTRLEQPYYQNSKYKDKSLLELRTDFQVNKGHLFIVEGDETYGKFLKELDEKIKETPRYVELTEITYGVVPATFRDSDLNDLRLMIWAITQGDKFFLFLNPLRTSFEIG